MFNSFRPAIAMIELIFSIVVMGIAILSVPAIISVSNNSGAVTTNQESISEASSHLQLIMTALWDENDFNNSSPILVDGGVAGVEFPGMVGRTDLDTNGSIFAPSTPGALGIDNPADDLNPNDIDDYDGNDFNVTLYNAETASIEAGNYLDQDVIIQTSVDYGSDITTASSIINNPFSTVVAASATDVKIISVTLTSNNIASKDIRVSAFVCNIGAFTIQTTGEDR
ncbi:MAG: hypothetical protein DRQ78_10650 [Epsilonproteobacteria bacterium]|nr:MAG: hypothetical protein DRQ78_10650 [Campylobacterota bacterium]